MMKKKSIQKVAPIKKALYQCLSYAIALSNSSCITDGTESQKDILDINFEQQYTDAYSSEELCSEFQEYIDVSNTSLNCLEHCEMQEKTDRLVSCQYEKGDQGVVQVSCLWKGACAIPGRWTSLVGPKPLALPYSIQEEMIRRLNCEISAVTAFERLAFELKAHQAPSELLAQIEVAIKDEKRHSEAFMKACFEQNWEINETYPQIKASDYPVRSLLEIAIENAMEGCVGESLAALENLYQSHFAQEPTIKAIHQSIAADEIEHAELSWQIHDWIEQRLTTREQALLKQALEQAILTQMSANLYAHLPETTKQYFGLPDQKTSKILLKQLDEQLWQKRLGIRNIG